MGNVNRFISSSARKAFFAKHKILVRRLSPDNRSIFLIRTLERMKDELPLRYAMKDLPYEYTGERVRRLRKGFNKGTGKLGLRFDINVD